MLLDRIHWLSAGILIIDKKLVNMRIFKERAIFPSNIVVNAGDETAAGKTKSIKRAMA
jgi:hypothetical protein